MRIKQQLLAWNYRPAETLWDDTPIKKANKQREWQEALQRLEADFTLGEVQACGEAMGRWKAPGEDGVPLECYVRLGDSIDRVVLVILNDAWRTG